MATDTITLPPGFVLDTRGPSASKDFGLRPDGTPKGTGFLGELKLPGGGVATEFSVGVQLESKGGEETDIPSLVPTLTKQEIALMVNDIIPNKKTIPDSILQKAVDHANSRVRAGKNIFADTEPATATLPSGFVLDQPVSAAGTELISGQQFATAEEAATARAAADERRREFIFNEGVRQRQAETRAALAPASIRTLEANLDRGLGRRPAVSLRKLPTLNLLEATSDLGAVKDFRARRRIIGILESRGVPKSAVNEFVVADRGPQGLEGLLKKEAVPTAFEIGGGIVGARAGKPIRGAIIGRTIGEVVQRAGERFFITERQKSLKADVTDAGINVALAGVGEWAARKLVSVGGTILKPAGRTRKTGINRLRTVLQEAGEQVTVKDIPPDVGEIVQLAKGGVGLADPAVITPGAATNSSLFGLLDNVSEKAITSMQRFRAGKARNVVAFGKHAENILDEFAEGLAKLDSSQLGGVLDDVIQGNAGALEAARGIYRQFYTTLDELGVGAVSNKRAIDIAQRLDDLVSKGRLLKGSDEGAEFVKSVAALAEESSFTEAISNRSTVLDWARKFDEVGERNAARLARELGVAMDDSMAQAARAHSTEAFTIWRRGNATFKAVTKRFEPKIISQLAKKASDNPDLAAKTIFKNKQPTPIKKVKKILLSPSGKTPQQIAEGRQTWKQLQNALVNDFYDRSRSTDKIIFGKKLDKALKDFGDEALAVTFSPKQVADLKEIARLGVLVQGKIKGEGGMFIQLAQPAAVAGIIAGKGQGRIASIAILATPPVWSRMALDPKLSGFLINGLADINKEGIKANTAATQKLLRVYFKERDLYFKEQTEIQKQRAAELRREAAQQVLPPRTGQEPFGGFGP